MQLKRPLFAMKLGGIIAIMALVLAACQSQPAAQPTQAPQPTQPPQVIERTVVVTQPPEVVERTVVVTQAPEIVERTVVLTQAPPPPETVVVTPTPAPLPGEGVTVQPARATWNTGYFQEAVYSTLLGELGYEIEDHQELDNPLFYQAVANGDVDYWANGWFPLHNQYRNVFEQGAEIAGTVAASGALEGYLVDMAGAEEFGITTLADFERPEVKEAYDADGNGMADLYACPPGWGCNGVIGFHLDEFGLRDHMDERTANYSVSMGEAVSRYRNGEHIVFYTWTPNWTVNQLVPGTDVVWIEVPEPAYPEEVAEGALSIPGVEGCVNDPCLMGFPANDINVVANTEFLNENPAAAALFEAVSIPLEDIFRQNNRMNAGENTQEDIDRHAVEWIATNREMVDQWLAQAMEAAANAAASN
jgi:glycine betaine/proline transport system substrate-binding protein